MSVRLFRSHRTAREQMSERTSGGRERERKRETTARRSPRALTTLSDTSQIGISFSPSRLRVGGYREGYGGP